MYIYFLCKIVHVIADLGMVVGGGGAAWKSRHTIVEKVKRGSRGGGAGGSGPSWKITSYMGFYRE